MNKRIIIVIAVVLVAIIGIILGPFVVGNFLGQGDTNQGTYQGDPYVNLTFWNVFDEKDLYDGLIQQYENTRREVDITYKKYTDLREFEEDFVNELAEGKGPDIIAIHNSWLMKHRGKLTPMPVELYQKGDPEVFRETFLPAAADDLIVDGEILNPSTNKWEKRELVYALPISMDSLAVIYNRELLLQFLSTNVPAADWDTFQNQVKRLTRKSSDGLQILRGGIAMGRADNIGRAADILHMLFLQRGAKLYDENMQRVQLASTSFLSGQSISPAEQALDFFTSFGDNRNINFTWDQNLTASGPDDKEMGAFARGEVAMIFGYAYQVKEIERLIAQYRTTTGRTTLDPANLKVAPAPQFSDDRVALANYFPLAVTKTSQNPDFAWDFINFLSQPEAQRYLFNKGHKLSGRIDMLQEQTGDSQYGAFAVQNAYARSALVPEMDEMAKVYRENIDSLLAGTSRAKDAVTDIQNHLQCMLDKLNDKESVAGVDCFE